MRTPILESRRHALAFPPLSFNATPSRGRPAPIQVLPRPALSQRDIAVMAAVAGLAVYAVLVLCIAVLE